ncbi:MAG: ArsA family ATPase [Candidatus Hermodarchaeota archaeon]
MVGIKEILDIPLKYVFFGGKGGVGKTTMAAATAVHAAEMGLNVLIISTDPAHSLSDSLNQHIGSEVVKVKGFDRLFALEINPDEAINDYANILSAQDPSGFVADFLEGDMSNITPPGADETVAFARLLDFIDNPQHDLIIFDTAPTGHTLRLLSLPDVMDSFLFKIINLRHKIGSLIGGIKRIFGRGQEGDLGEAMKALEDLRKKVESGKHHLTNSKETTFVAVTIPTQMAIYETERLVRALYEYEIPISNVIVNQIMPENPSCSFCSSVHKMHIENMEKIKFLYEDFGIIKIPMFESEIRGIDRLRKLAENLFSNAE